VKGQFRPLKEPLSKVSAKGVLLKYVIKVQLTNVQCQGSLYYWTAQRI